MMSSVEDDDDDFFDGVLEERDPTSPKKIASPTSMADINRIIKENAGIQKSELNRMLSFTNFRKQSSDLTLVPGENPNIRFSNVNRQGNLCEPSIYANRLLGLKINTTEKIIIKKENGKVVRTVINLADVKPDDMTYRR